LNPPVHVHPDVTSHEKVQRDLDTSDSSTPLPPDAEVLIKEAHQRKRRRRLRLVGIVVVILGVAGLIVHVLHDSRPPTPNGKRTVPRAKKATPPAAKIPTRGAILEHPHGLAVGADGALYVVDTGRDQVLRRLPTGRFVVLAGNGHRGFSGDGGPATNAELSLTNYSGLATGPNGTLYIADSGNDRVREVLSNGSIDTVAGNGNSGMVLSATPALQASLGEVSGLAIGLDGDLYIATSDVVQLTPSGTIEWVAGNRQPPSCGSIYCNPASEWDFTDPDQIAFDGSGDLFVSDGNGFDLYEIAANGQLDYLGAFRGDGAPGALAAAPDGSVVEAWCDGLTRLLSDGQTSAIGGNLDVALGRAKHVLGGYNVFIAGDGVAVAPNGGIYLDTNTGNTFTAVSALVEVSPKGIVTVLWRS
jgi:hypothetical protein